MERWLNSSQRQLCSFEQVLFLLPPAGSLELDWSKRFCARCSRIWQTPFSFCVLRPHNLGSNQRNFLDHQPPRKERKETNAQPECSCLQEIFRPDRYGLRNRDAAKFKSAPGSDAHAANFERNAEAASSVPAESFLVPLVIAHTGSRRAKPPHQVQSMPPERSLPAGAIFAPSDVTQPQFESKTKA